jgi:hypothetical protein
MKKRGTDEGDSKVPGPADAASDESKGTMHWEPANYTYHFSDLPDDGPHEYSWKTELCTCDTREEAWQMGQVLGRAGIDSWIQQPRGSGGLDGPRVMVGADQLEHARAIAAQPIPQDIIDESRELDDAPAYENPKCPKCHAPDPTLESVEPSNNWLCESCGYTWSDPAVENAENPETASS